MRRGSDAARRAGGRGDLPELLAPAGCEAAFLAAVAAGADAVYLGGKQFSARAFADNFDDEMLARCIALAHAHGVRVYVTVNTLLYDPELPHAVAYAARLYEMGVDALICADVGLAAHLRAHLPALPLHASTQFSLHSTTGAREVADLGFTQVVVARELPREEIERIVEGAPETIEVFVHGALCVSHSGQCLFSSLVGGRSGNRGVCAQPCRLPYNEGRYLLSLKDLSLAAHITSLIDAGVASLKIEGRMKSPDYVGRVTAIYRRLLDERRNASHAEMAELERIFSRSGTTDGYYVGAPNGDMMGVRRDADKAESRAVAAAPLPALPPIPLRAEVCLRAGEPARLTMRSPSGREATVRGETPASARSAPLTADAVYTRLAKLGQTPFSLSREALSLTLDEGLNLSPAALNALRRDAVACLLDTTRTAVPLPSPTRGGEPPFASLGRTALVMTAAQYEVLRLEEPSSFDLVFLPLWLRDDVGSPPCGVYLPPVIFDGEEPEIRQRLDDARRRGATHALVGNPAGIALAREAGLTPVGDHRLNITNCEAALYYRRHGVIGAVLTPELTPAGMRALGGQAIVYGHIPLMLTERCMMRPLGGCRVCGEKPLVDRRGVAFPILRLPPHRNLILNSVPTYLGDRRDLLPAGLGTHFLFTCETPRRVREVLAAYRQAAPLPFAVRRTMKNRR